MSARRPRVLVTRRWPEPVEAQLRRDFDATLNQDDRALSSAELAAALRDYDAVCPTVTDRLTAELFAATPRRCRIVANIGVGYEHIDVAAARAAGVLVTNTPDVLTDATADLSVALLLDVARRVSEGDRLVRAGRWSGWAPTQMLGVSVTGKTLGIVGLGRIGRAVARRALAFGLSIRAWGPRLAAPPAELPSVGVAQSLADLLSSADFVSLHCPATRETHHLIDRAALALMRPTAMLINTARGTVVEEAALFEALRNGRLAGAALDVYEREPQVHPGLLELPNVVLAPHLGSATLETRTAMGLRALDNLRAFFAGRAVPDPVC
ncbi:MAG: D-glycerate dehydrogenase [Steroidobacteraceae bacterium]|nr:D-glycerate dehydrogenase [Steroidobacteraceae bacterium]MDW8260551.1 D-glycerate dehydrogenase [Gammaproteobacteria bacterium]